MCLGNYVPLTRYAVQVPGAEVKVYRVQDPVQGDDPSHFEEGVLDAPPVTEQVDQAYYQCLLASLCAYYRVSKPAHYHNLSHQLVSNNMT